MKLPSYIAVIFLVISCNQNNASTPSEPVPDIYKRIYGASDMYVEGDFIVIKTQGIPDHNSPYYLGTQWNNERYEQYSGDNPDWDFNPGRIASFDFTFTIPINPSEANNHRPTALGSIGISLNGVSFYNQYAGLNNQPLTDEVNSFDQYKGHPQPQGVYHYHIEPTYLTNQSGRDALLGFLLDGFPVYGPVENGQLIQNSDLDEFHGHEHVTTDYPDGIYHYHITDADPYINGSGYYGTPGTVTL